MSEEKAKPSKGAFNLDKLRVGQNFMETVGVKKTLLTVPVRKPNRQEFIRVHPDENMRLPVAVVEMKEDREVFLVSPELVADFPNEVVSKLLLTAINRQGVLFLWPINLPGENDRVNQWNSSAMSAADLATKGWVRISSNMSLGAYEVFQATNNLPEPSWPEFQLEQILEVAFKDRFITTIDHPVIKKLFGEV